MRVRAYRDTADGSAAVEDEDLSVVSDEMIMAAMKSLLETAYSEDVCLSLTDEDIARAYVKMRKLDLSIARDIPSGP